MLLQFQQQRFLFQVLSLYYLHLVPVLSYLSVLFLTPSPLSLSLSLSPSPCLYQILLLLCVYEFRFVFPRYLWCKRNLLRHNWYKARVIRTNCFKATWPTTNKNLLSNEELVVDLGSVTPSCSEFSPSSKLDLISDFVVLPFCLRNIR